MLNMLSFSEVSRHFRIIVDTTLSNHINVHVTSVLNLVDDNKSHYTASDIAKEDAAKKLYEHLTIPGYQKFICLLDSIFFGTVL